MPNPSPSQRSAPGLHAPPAPAIARRPPPAAQAGAYNDSASEGSLTIDHTGRIVDARGKLQSLLGVAAPPQAGRRLADWCPDAGLLAAVDSAAAGDRPHRTMLVRAGLDGRVRHLLVQVVPFGPAPSAARSQMRRVPRGPTSRKLRSGSAKPGRDARRSPRRRSSSRGASCR